MDRHQQKHLQPLLLKALRLMCLAALLTVLLVGCDSPSPPVTTNSSRPPVKEAYEGTIVAVGNSLTAGLGVSEVEAYPSLLAGKLAADGYAFKVINAGVSGETSTGTLARIEWVIASLQPDIVILETGANDGLRGIDPKLLENNLDRIITILKASDVQVILAGMLMLPNLGPEYTQAFATIYPQAALKHGIGFIPFFLEGVAGVSRYNQADRLHPTAEGYQIIVANIYDHVISAVKRHEARQKQKDE